MANRLRSYDLMKKVNAFTGENILFGCCFRFAAKLYVVGGAEDVSEALYKAIHALLVLRFWLYRLAKAFFFPTHHPHMLFNIKILKKVKCI